MPVRSVPPRVRVAIERWLSRTVDDGSWLEAALGWGARGYGATSARHLARPLRLPEGLPSVTVGGATLGGSGKTRLALACAAALAERSLRVAFVGHAYGASPSRARLVEPGASLRDVGDEALTAAAFFARRGLTDRASVVVAPSRAKAVASFDALGFRPDVVVLDGPLQLAPSPASLALLAVDRDAPWGSGRVVPSGDLRAPIDALAAAADRIVPIDAMPQYVTWRNELRALSELPRYVRTGFFSAIARPERLLEALTRAGFLIGRTLRAPNHGPLDAHTRRALLQADDVELWLTTEKCRVHLDDELSRALGDKLAVLHADVDLPDDLKLRLAALAPSAPPCPRERIPGARIA